MSHQFLRQAFLGASGEPRYSNGGVVFSGQGLQSSGSAGIALRDALVAAGSLTVEVWAATGDVAQTGPARLVTLSSGTSLRAFHVAQDGSAANFRIRSSATDPNGNERELFAPAFLDTAPHHLLFTFNGDESVVRVFVDGALSTSALHAPDGILDWTDDAYALAMGDETNNRMRPFLGTIFRVAVYDRVLTDSDIRRLFEAGP